MPSLNRLRTKGGVIVTIVIFLALIAFIVGDLFSSGGMLFRNRKMRVGEIAGKNIGYMEFYQQSEYMGQIYRMMYGRDAISSQEQEAIYDSAWDQLIAKYSYEPSFDNMGLLVSFDEQLDMTDGVYLSPVITSFFANPQTGMFDPEMMKYFMSFALSDDNTNAVWTYIKNQMVQNRTMTKYLNLVSEGFYANTVDVAAGVRNANEVYSANVVAKPYFVIPDSLVKVSNSQIKSYYNSHKEMFKQTASRDIEYVLFDVVPSEADYKTAEDHINDVAREFAETDTPMQYATLNSQERPDNRYYKEEDMLPAMAAIAFGKDAGKLYGPVLTGDTYTISRLADIKSEPDSLEARHILLENGQVALADSLVQLIRGRRADFAALAAEYSLDQSVIQNGGDLGRFAPEQMIPEFSEAAINARQGDVYTVESQFGLHVVQLIYKARPVQKAQIATVTYKVDPSSATIAEIYSRASRFVTDAEGTVEGFRNTANEDVLAKRTVRIQNTDRNISGLENSKELIRWAFTNKKGVVSPIMEINGDYLVAALTEAREEGYAPVEQVAGQIRETLMNEEKVKLVASQIAGTGSIGEVASRLDEEVKEVEDVTFGSMFLASLGMEPRVSGAITAVPQGRLSKPVEGYSGVHVFEVTGSEKVENATAQSEKVRLDSEAQFYIQERAIRALEEESGIKDMRVKFF